MRVQIHTSSFPDESPPLYMNAAFKRNSGGTRRYTYFPSLPSPTSLLPDKTNFIQKEFQEGLVGSEKLHIIQWFFAWLKFSMSLIF